MIFAGYTADWLVSCFFFMKQKNEWPHKENGCIFLLLVVQ